MTIYIDVIILENLIMNYIILYATAIIVKKKARLFRILIASLIRSNLCNNIIYISNTNIFINNFKILLSIVMVYIAFKSSTLKELSKQVLIFYMTSFVFGGAALSLLHFIKPQEIYMENGAYKGEYTLKVVFLGGIVGFTIIIMAFKAIKTKISSRDIFYEIEINI